MPTVNPGGKVLVTGANGFIAFWLIKELLEKGYSVRGTVRSIQKSGEHIKRYFEPYGDRFELVEVRDITKEGAFDHAIQGVDAVEHTASAVDISVEDPQDYIGPAVNGTVSLLTSALKYGSNLKRFIYVSSIGALRELTPPLQPTTYTEKDWNDEAIKLVETLGKDANPFTKYCASKTLAERAAWDFVAKHKNEIGWDLGVIIPPHVFGPTIHQVSSLAELNGSNHYWWTSVVEPGPQSKEVALLNSPWVDVRDLANGLVLGFEKEAAGGERISVSAGSYVWQDWINAASSLESSPFSSRKLPAGYPEEVPVYTSILDTSKAARILGMESYRTIAETVKDMLADFAARGW